MRMKQRLLQKKSLRIYRQAITCAWCLKGQVFVTGSQGQLNGYIILNAAPSWALSSQVLYPTETLTCDPNDNYAITKTAVNMSTLLTATWIGGKVLRLSLASGIAQDKDIHVIALGY